MRHLLAHGASALSQEPTDSPARCPAACRVGYCRRYCVAEVLAAAVVWVAGAAAGSRSVDAGVVAAAERLADALQADVRLVVACPACSRAVGADLGERRVAADAGLGDSPVVVGCPDASYSTAAGFDTTSDHGSYRSNSCR